MRPLRRFARESKDERRSLLAPANVGLEAPSIAPLERGEHERELEPVLGDRFEEAEGAVDDDAMSLAVRRDGVEQLQELEPAKERAQGSVGAH